MILKIHGLQYNLADFQHPGGNEILELCKDEPDCTALFESYHAFCDMDKINRLMKKYEMPDSKYEQIFSFEPNGFYNVLKRRVISYLEQKKSDKKKLTRGEVKANRNWLLLVMGQIALFIYAQRELLFGTFWLSRIFFGLVSGVTIVGIGFNVLHDASHYAISINPKMNQLCSSVIQSLMFLNHILWSFHHVIRHHQYTGMIEYDPDMRHSMPFLRKSSKFPLKSATFRNPYLITKMLLFNIVFPGSAVGQALSYHIQWNRKGMMWKMKLPELYSFANSIGQYTLSALFLGTMIRYAGIYTIFHLIATNLTYFIGLSPDHDLFPTHLETEKFCKSNDKSKKMDWGEQQVRASADFCRNSWFITRFMGGINYQIEHHLFPSLNNVFLEEISPIVQKTCTEFQIAYNFVDNPRDVFDQLSKTYLDAASSDSEKSDSEKSDSEKSDSEKSDSNKNEKSDSNNSEKATNQIHHIKNQTNPTKSTLNNKTEYNRV
jgi:fatty acid desaturase